MIKKAVIITLLAQVVGIGLVMANLNFSNSSTATENLFTGIGAMLFLFSPVVMLVYLGAAKVKAKRSGQPGPSMRFIVLAGVVIVGAWALLLVVNWANYALRGQAAERQMQSSQARTEQNNAAARQQREADWATTCVTARNISSDLQMSATFRDFEQAKTAITGDQFAAEREQVNLLIREINQDFKDCDAGTITPTEERSQISARLLEAISVIKNR